MNRTNLRALVDTYMQAQKARVAWSNRVSALSIGTDTEETPQLLQAKKYMEQFFEIETGSLDEIQSELDVHPVWPFLKRVKGIGPTLASKLLCDVDIHKAVRVSNLWSFAGLGVVNGRAPRPVKGEKLRYSKRLRTACFLVARSFLMVGSPYVRIYKEAKIYFAANRPDWKPIQVDLTARRKMVKIFLSHLWVKWREAEGLSVTVPYAYGPLGHDMDTFMRPDEFVQLVTESNS